MPAVGRPWPSDDDSTDSSLISDAEVRPPLTAYPDGREKQSEYIVQICVTVIQQYRWNAFPVKSTFLLIL